MSAECVWYRTEDHAGFGRRLAALGIDLLLLTLLMSILPFVASRVQAAAPTAQPTKPLPPYTTWVLAGYLLAFALPYHVLLRRTPRGTPGHRILGLRLVSILEERPSLSTLMKRFIIAVAPAALLFLMMVPQLINTPRPAVRPRMTTGLIVGQIVLLLILVTILLAPYWRIIWDRNRQGLHDKYAGTWVIRAGAVPAGSARPIRCGTFLGSIAIPYWDVEPCDGSPVESVPAAHASTSL